MMRWLKQSNLIDNKKQNKKYKFILVHFPQDEKVFTTKLTATNKINSKDDDDDLEIRDTLSSMHYGHLPNSFL